MITIAVCDDTAPERKMSMEFCRNYFKNKKEEYQIFEYESGAVFLENEFADILLLEIKIKHMDGIFLKDLLQIMGAKTRIMFICREEEFMPRAFGKNVFGYLGKPLDYECFCVTMDRIIEDIEESRNYIYCREIVDYEKIYRKIHLKQINYVEARGHKTIIYTQMGKCCVESDKRIGEWKGEYLKEGFACCHRSYVVNLYYVVRVEKEVELMNGIHIPISCERRAEFCEAVKKYKQKRK